MTLDLFDRCQGSRTPYGSEGFHGWNGCTARFRVIEGHEEHHTTTVMVVRGVTLRVSDG